MAVVTKSNAVSSRSIGNLFGIKGASDYSLVLDFQNDVYASRNTSGRLMFASLQDMVSCTRAGPGTYRTEDGTLETAPANVARLSYVDGHRGLLIEGARTNVFRNSQSPATQTVALAATPNIYCVWVEGAGSIAVSGTNITVLSASAVATSATPVVFRNTDPAQSASAVFTVSGSLAFAQCEQLGANIFAKSSHIITTTAAASRSTEKVELTDLAKADAFRGALNGYTVLVYFYAPKIPAPAGITPATRIASQTAAGAAYIQTEISEANRRITAKTEAVRFRDLDMIPPEDHYVAAFSLDNVNAPLFGYNGGRVAAFSGATTADMTANPTIKFPAESTLYSLFGIIRRVVVYPRAMNGDDLAALSGSWVS